MRHPTSVRIIVSVLLTFVFGGVFVAYAGSLTPSASPAATMNTVAEVYNAVASTTFDSSAISASSTGSLVQILKNISANLGWSVSSNNLSNSNSGTVAIDSSDWDINATGAITGVAFDANGTGNTLTNVDNGDLTADTLDFTAIADSTALDADTAIAAGTGEEITYTKSFTNATSENGLVMSFTALDTTSGTTAQYGLYLDNVASTEGADALLVLDNSDTDDIITAAIKIIDAGGGFTTLLDNAGTLISGAEFNVLDGGITHGEITDSGTLTVTTADINGGNIDGTTIGATTAGAITGTAITGTSFVIGANTLTTSEWAFLDGQNQAVLTTSNPTFGNLTITSFAANWTNAGRTVADLGIVTTADINGGTVDGTTIGATSAAAGTFSAITSTGTLTLDGVTTDITTDTDEALTLSPNGTGDIVISADADTNLQVTAGAAPGVDIVAITNSGQGTTTSGIDGIAVNLVQADDADATDTNAALAIDADTASGDADTFYGMSIDLDNTGNAAKTTQGMYVDVASSSTTADTLIGVDVVTAHTGNISSATKSVYGVRSLPSSAGATDAGGTINTYGGYFDATGATGGTANVYGVFIADVSGGDNNYGLCFDCDGTWTASTVAAGIQFGTDANAVTLYRSASDTLRTGDNLTVDLGLTVSGGDTIVANGFGIVIGNATQITSGATGEFQVLGTGQEDTTQIIGAFGANAFSGAIQFVKSRNATIGSNTIVQDDDAIGAVSAFPDDGVDFATEAAAFSFEVDDGTPAAGDIGMAFVWKSMAGGGTTLTEKMRLAANGQLTLAAGGLLERQGADVASTNNLALGADGNAFEITGTTQINLLSNIGWQNGAMVTLLFTTTPTVKHNQATSGTNITIQLAGAADFVASAGDTLTLILSEIGGTQAWREVARSVI